MTSKLHDSPTDKLALLKVKVELPVSVDPTPQKPSVGKAVAVKPLSVAFRSLVKVISEASLLLSVLLRLKFRVTEVPGCALDGKFAKRKGLVTVSRLDALPVEPPE